MQRSAGTGSEMASGAGDAGINAHVGSMASCNIWERGTIWRYSMTGPASRLGVAEGAIEAAGSRAGRRRWRRWRYRRVHSVRVALCTNRNVAGVGVRVSVSAGYPGCRVRRASSMTGRALYR